MRQIDHVMKQRRLGRAAMREYRYTVASIVGTRDETARQLNNLSEIQ